MSTARGYSVEELVDKTEVEAEREIDVVGDELELWDSGIPPTAEVGWCFPRAGSQILIACTYDSRLQNRRPRCSLTYFLRRRTVRRGSWEHGAASCLNMIQHPG